MDSIHLVREFHELFNHEVAPEPKIPDAHQTVFRTTFMREELLESEEAFVNQSLTGIIDALADLQYVLDGWFLNAGLLKYKDAIMTEVHRSNMTKACSSMQEALDTVETLSDLHGDDEKPTEYRIEPKTVDAVAYFIVKRVPDGKVMKSINYSKPDFLKVISES